MPLYDYRCKECSTLFECVHSIQYEGEIHCEHCGSAEVVKSLTKCQFSRGNDQSAELEQVHREHHQKFMPQKKRVQKLLNEMSSEKNPTVVGPGGCVQHTRMELEERYGSIF